jgi:DNA polymerase-1
VANNPIETPSLLLLDASGFLFRAYHALPPLTNPAGVPVGAVYGYCSMLLRLQQNHPGVPLLVVFDAGRTTFRQSIYPAYKANRPDPPADLVPQFALIRDATTAFGLPQVELAGVEADDLLASYAAAAERGGQGVTIVSSDKDLMQLVRPNVQLLDPIKNLPLAEAEVLVKFGVTPDKVVEVQALAGDSSDNVPGVPGIGIKTAAELINRFGSVDNLLANLDQITQPKRRQALQENAELARISRQLVRLKDDVPCPIALADIQAVAPNPDSLRTFFVEQGFRQLVNRLGGDSGAVATGNTEKTTTSPTNNPTPAVNRPITSLQTLADWLAGVAEVGQLAVTYLKNEGGMQLLLAMQAAEQVSVALSNPAGAAPIRDLLSPSSTLDPDSTPAPALPRQAVADLLNPLLQDNRITKIGVDWKSLWRLYPELTIVGEGVEDLQLMGYIANASRGKQDLPSIAARFHPETPEEKPDETPAATLLTLFPQLQQALLAVQGLAVYAQVDRPIPAVVARMEQAGVRLDVPFLRQLNQRFAAKLAELAEEVYRLANGKRFLIGSPKQLGEVLFEELGLPASKRGKSGSYETGVEVLEPLAAAGHVIAEKVLAWRQIAKLQSTYVEALLKLATAQASARVHTTFLLAQTSTGRFSSIDPNLQNIPIRSAEGKALRTAFIAEAGWKLLSADYSQIELRLLAHMADVPSLRQAFSDGVDIHALTAAEVFHTPLDQVDAALRRSAKAVNFGIIYGISAFGLAAQLGVGNGEAADIIKRYFARYPGIQDYMEAMRTAARQQGYVTTLFGRRCLVPEIQDKNPARRQFAERAAINAPLQGTAADLIKRAMTRVDALLRQQNAQTRLLLQVHDELLLEGPEGELQRLLPPICAAMATAAEPAVKLHLPLVVEAKIGNNWGEAH